MNIASSSVREPIDNLALSNAVRPGVVGWAKTLAREVGPDGITVNSIAPGRIDTAAARRGLRQAPGSRGSDADPAPPIRPAREVADSRLLPRLRPGGYVTGAVIPVDGGLTRGLL